MERFLYNYQTIVRFYQPVGDHFIKLRCVPCENDCQHVCSSQLTMHPDIELTHDTDAYGNDFIYGSALDVHDSLAYVSSGVVELSSYVIPDHDVPPYYKCASAMTAVSDDMKRTDFAPCGEVLTDAMSLCHLVHGMMEYVPSSTDGSTTAAEAFALRKGVCQDYAHIMIALCRYYGMAARYVNGFIAGEGATHAWVEVYDGASWRGFDPTHDLMIEYGYIKLAHGRDANDCPVSRGTFVGGTGQVTEIRVIVYQL